MSTDFHTVFNDLKTSLGLAKKSVLSYLLANLGMVFVIAILFGIIAVPIVLLALVTTGLFWENMGLMMSTWATHSPLLVGGIGILVMIPIVSLFLVVVGSIYGMSNDLVMTGETKAEAAFSYLRHKFLAFGGAGAILTIIVIVPQVVVWGTASYLLGYTVVGLAAQALTAFSFIWTFVTIGLTSMVLPAVVNGKGVQAAVSESFRLAVKHFDRVFGLWTGIVLLAVAMFAPVMIWGLAVNWTMMAPELMFLPVIGALGAWTVIAGLLWILLLFPMVVIAFVKVYHEITDGKVAPKQGPDVPIV
ncbi:MAG: hypothetical protein C4K49_11875 [Candidatus Thorarchaeota archaeon]|nr:MAG: hypothetical protein C4K49_11875 [Candidatus Thorarchaeota archaeon]